MVTTRSKSGINSMVTTTMVTTRSKSGINSIVTTTTTCNRASTTSKPIKSIAATNTKTNVDSRVASTRPAETVERRITRSLYQKQQLGTTSANSIQAISTNSNKQQERILPLNVAQVQGRKPTRDERRHNEALLELETLGEVASLIVSGKRKRKQAEHQDAAFVLASFKQRSDSGRKGGIVAGSRHHYDRKYRS